MDFSEKTLCIKCDEGGNLLVCNENGCPLAMHEGCVGCPARFDDAGQFYCPYCWYKRAIAAKCQAREYAQAKKRALSVFMDEVMTGNDKHLEENKRAEGEGGRNSDVELDQSIHLDEEHRVSDAAVEEIVRELEHTASAGSKGEDPSLMMHEEPKISSPEEDKTHEEDIEVSVSSKGEDPSLKMDKEQNINREEENKIQEEKVEASAGSKYHNPSLQMHGELKISTAEGEKNQEEKLETSAASADQDPSLKMHEEEKIQEKEGETVAASTGADRMPSVPVRVKIRSPVRMPSVPVRVKIRFKKRDPADNGSTDVPLQNKLVEQSDKNKQASPNVNSPRRSSRRLSSAKDMFGCGKRNKLLWREEEEKKLKEGVQKLSNNAARTIPWTKILEYGQNVFDGTRTPSDLQDKWKEMRLNRRC